MASKKIKPPKGTRDLYPEDLLRQRYITNAWRDASIRCGFDEIAGPTFESTELYAVKSGDAILGELFQTFSGKGGAETLDKLVEKGKADFALRPEFTPTLARMYAAHAKQLPKPCKWFTAGPYFRAERPQRGRLREFLQWNVDVIGLPSEDATPESKAQMDSEIIEVSVNLFNSIGFNSEDIQLHYSDRNAIADLVLNCGVNRINLDEAFALLDRRSKMKSIDFISAARDISLNIEKFDKIQAEITMTMKHGLLGDGSLVAGQASTGGYDIQWGSLASLANLLRRKFDQDWMNPDFSIVRGLAYYTGTVFEALADGERAVAGGGRYDNLIELFGGPPTPACGFGMGDVVLGNLLDDKELMPKGVELKEAVARPQASIRPEAFVVPNGDEANEALVHTLTANLRRGIESESWSADDSRKPWQASRYTVAPMHARISYKSTRKINKLKADASDQHAKFFVEIQGDNKVELTNMDAREAITSQTHSSFSVDPAAENYVGRAIMNHM